MLIRYCLVGLINTSVSVGVMLTLAWLGFHYAVYAAIAYSIAFCTSYVLNGLFTFRSSSLSSAQFLLFIAVNGSLLMATEALQFALIELLATRELVGVGSGLVFYTAAGFLLNRNLVYRAPITGSVC